MTSCGSHTVHNVLLLCDRGNSHRFCSSLAHPTSRDLHAVQPPPPPTATGLMRALQSPLVSQEVVRVCRGPFMLLSPLITGGGGSRAYEPPPLPTPSPPTRVLKNSGPGGVTRRTTAGLTWAAKSPRREVVRSSAGADTVHPPFWGSFA